MAKNKSSDEKNPSAQAVPETITSENKAPTLTEAEIRLAESKTESISAEDLAAPLIANMPEPTSSEAAPPIMPEAPEAPEEKQQAEQPSIQREFTEVPKHDSRRDRGGKTFDPTKHKANSDGSPRVDGRGFFIPLNKGRPKASEAGAEKTAQTEAPKPNAASFINTSGVPDQFDNAAEMYLNFGYGVAANFLSEGIRPDDATEHNSLKIPLAGMLREKGSIDLSPTMMFLVAVGAYVGKKSANPSVRERLVLWYLKGKGLFEKLMGKKTAKVLPIADPKNLTVDSKAA